MSDGAGDISLLGDVQRDEAAEVLADAFRDNPVYVAALRGASPDARRKKLGKLYRGFAAACLRIGEASAVLTDGKIVAVALAYPPGRYPFSFGTWLVNGLPAAFVGPGHTLRLARLDGWMRKNHLQGPHWYLYQLGVLPSLQGKGLGTRLLRRHIALAERDGVPCYLETDTEENVSYYSRFGYRVTADQVVPGVGVRMWLMLRD